MSAADVIDGAERWALIQGEALAALRALPDACVDAVVTDPPYSSGGQYRGDRMAVTDTKYTSTESQGRRPDFWGDNRDQRGFQYWCALWLSECLRVAKPGAPCVLFSDWRQVPTVTDALQAGGWIWRGSPVWDKTEASRPRMGGFRSQCEHMVWGTRGPIDDDVAREVGCLPGVFRVGVRQDDKFHQTGKPTELMRQVVAICRPGGIVLDPFAGSGTTLVAALMTGRRAIGFEWVGEYSDVIAKRCAAVEVQADWRKPEQASLFGGAKA